jgi:hypothetical protein
MTTNEIISFFLTLKQRWTLPRVPLGGLPDFQIIGAQKSGTSSLYRYLCSHPRVYGRYRKELQYYSKYRDKGLGWYRQHFPADSPKKERMGLIAGEASPYYIYHPRGAEMLHEDTPDVKLILLMRDPVKRAYSHYTHNLRMSKIREPLSFIEALEQEDSRLEKEIPKLEEAKFYYSYIHQHVGYKARGRYLEQIKRYHKIFPKEQLLILAAEDFFKNRQSVMDIVCDHLEIERYKFKTLWKYNAGRYKAPMPDEAKEHLLEHFVPLNQDLYDYLGSDFGWMR